MTGTKVKPAVRNALLGAGVVLAAAAIAGSAHAHSDDSVHHAGAGEIAPVQLGQATAAKGRFGNAVTVTIEGDRRCVVSNGLPDHETGRFPNAGNPNTISAQAVRYCFSRDPVKGESPRLQVGSIGVAINGVTIRPGTADWWDGSSRRGFSRDPASGWNLEGLGSRTALGMDTQNAHVDHRGLYHYHGVAAALAASARGSLIGYAADGFEIHYAGGAQTSSYRLKPDIRPTPPGGAHDGRFNQDWAYVAGAGSLDACNGGTLDGRFVYFATDTYPFFPRCLWGAASADFGRGQGGGGEGARGGHGRAGGASGGFPPRR